MGVTKMPDDYVKRSDALQAVGDIHPLDYNGQGIVERIKAIPAADVVEVRHGRLLNPNPYGECSLCGYLMDIRDGYKYCPSCGAKMDGGQDDD